MHLPAVTSSPAPLASPYGGEPAVPVGVMLLGVRVTAYAIINIAEHQRRETAGMGAVIDPALLDRLMDLPIGISVTDPVAWAEMADQPRGVAERHEDGARIIRRLESPLTIADVVVGAVTGQTCRPGRQLVRWFHAPLDCGHAQPDTRRGDAGGKAVRRRHRRSAPQAAAAGREARRLDQRWGGHGCWRKRRTGAGLPDGPVIMSRRAQLEPLTEPAMQGQADPAFR